MKNVYDVILSGGTDEEALAYAAAISTTLVSLTSETIDIQYKRYVGSMNGVGVYYDSGLDYYLFAGLDYYLFAED